jgi:hypothetical protein
MIASTFLRKLSNAVFSNFMPFVKGNDRAAKSNAEKQKAPSFLRSFAHANEKFPKARLSLGRSLLVARHALL